MEVRRIRFDRLWKSVSVTPNCNINNAPICSEIALPKLSADIKMAYIVPSIFLGHILQANTNTGIEFSSDIM